VDSFTQAYKVCPFAVTRSQAVAIGMDSRAYYTHHSRL